MMRKLFYLMVFAALFAACGSDGPDDPIVPEQEVLTLDAHRFEVSAEGDTISVQVAGNVAYSVAIPEEFSSWMSKMGSVAANMHRFVVRANGTSSSREGFIVFTGGALKDTVYVVQAAVAIETDIEMVFVKGGTFMMGAADDSDVREDEKPVHPVTLSDYYIGKYEVTQGLWMKVMSDNPSRFKKGDNYPVERVSWDSVQEFLMKLNSLTGKNYVLPTEAQWEYAARGGAESKGYKYSGSDELDEVAWYDKESTCPVGTKQPNELGLYDMSGNVKEWCGDWFGPYSDVEQVDPVGPQSGAGRVFRGDSWYDYGYDCRLTLRFYGAQSSRQEYLGFRLALLP